MAVDVTAAVGPAPRAFPRLDVMLLLIVNLAGLGTYLYPFAMAETVTPSSTWYEHRGDGPLLMAGVAALSLAVVVSQLTTGRLTTRSLAVLAVLAALAAMLRTITLPAGANLYFLLVILGSWVFGVRLGFLLGVLSFVLSAVVTGGIGPWLPFQVFAAGWLGMTAGWLGRRTEGIPGGPRAERGVIVAFGFAWGIAFGAILNLWSWPYWVGGPDVTFDPAAGLIENARRYWNFYLLTSAGWDLARAVCNALALAFLAGPLLQGLRRFHRRFAWEGP